MWYKLRCFYRSFYSRRFISYSFVDTEQTGGVFSISINRPSVRNAVNKKTALELREAFNIFEQNVESRVAVLSGRSGTFCSGYDLKELSQENLKELLTSCTSTDGPMGPTRMYFTKPVIAAVSGYAVGGGMELALCCDLRVVEDDAVMGYFNRRFGVPLIDGGTVRLPKLVGLSHAMDLILTGRPVNAEEALRIGLANRVVPKGTAYKEALKLANQIASFPQVCLNADRQSAYNAVYNSSTLSGSLDYEKSNAADCLEGAAAGAGRFVSGLGHGGKFENPE